MSPHVNDEVVDGEDRHGRQKSGLADWAQAPFYRFLSFVTEDHVLLHLSISGILMLSKHDKLAEVLYETRDNQEDVEEAAQLKESRRVAALARQEIERGFPLLHAHATVALWSALESLVEDIAVSWLANDPTTLQLDRVGRLKIPAADFELLAREDRLRHMAQLLKEDVKASLRLGSDQLDAVLDVLNLGGPVPEDTRKKLYELQQVRNVLVHRRSIVDRHLLSRCPWLTWQVGDTVIITTGALHDYDHAAQSYALHLINRVRSRCGLREIWSAAASASEVTEDTSSRPESEADEPLGTT
jgi:hypothetical protein